MFYLIGLEKNTCNDVLYDSHSLYAYFYRIIL